MEKCPRCYSKNVSRTGLAVGVGTGKNLPATSPQYFCNNCKKYFNRSDLKNSESKII